MSSGSVVTKVEGSILQVSKEISVMGFSYYCASLCVASVPLASAVNAGGNPPAAAGSTTRRKGLWIDLLFTLAGIATRGSPEENGVYRSIGSFTFSVIGPVSSKKNQS
jgi:hypothetical protein